MATLKVDVKINLEYFSFKRPVSIGVYGHPSHENSHYTLAVYQIVLADGDTFDEQNPTESFSKKDHTKVNFLIFQLLELT